MEAAVANIVAFKALGAGIAVIALAGVGIGIGNIFSSLVTAVARNPSARAEAQASIANAIDQAKQAAAAQSATANAKLEAQIAAAEQSIGVARTAAMGALREVATDTANTVINRLIGFAPDSARVDSAVGALLAARGQA